MRNYFLPYPLLIFAFALIFNPLRLYAQAADGAALATLRTEADLLFYNYKYAEATKVYDKIIANANPQQLPQKIEALFQKSAALRNMQKLAESTDLLNDIHAVALNNKEADNYSLALAWMAKASYYNNYKQGDSFQIALAKADAYITQLPEQENFWESKLYYHYLKQEQLSELTQKLERKTTILTAIAYADKIKNSNTLLKGVVYERWLNISLVLAEDNEIKPLLSQVEKMLKNPYFKPYKQLEAGLLNRKMILAGFWGDSISFGTAAKQCLDYIKQNQLLETFAYAEYLQFFALIQKDVRINYPAARQTYRELLAFHKRHPEVINRPLYLSSSLNYAYTQLDNRFDPKGIDTGLVILEELWQLCLSPAYRGGKWGEFPDMSQVAARAASLQDCAAVLQALTHGYNQHYNVHKEEKYRQALYNSLNASETLLFSTLKTTSSESQRNHLSHTIEEFFIRKTTIYRDLYRKKPNSESVNQLWQIAQQRNGRASAYRQSEEKALQMAKVDKELSSAYISAKKQLENALLGLAIAQKDNNNAEIITRTQQIANISQQVSNNKKQIEQKYPLFGRIVEEVDWVKMETLRPWLKNSALILHYSGRENTYQILLTSDTVILYDCSMQRERVARKLVDSLNLFLANPPQENAVEKIYKIQFERLLLRAKDTFFRQAAYLEKQRIRNVIIVPDELTAAIPYEILLTASGNSDKSYPEWAWGLKTFNFQYLPSLPFWVQSRQQTQTNDKSGKLLAFAPTYQNGVKNPLRSKELSQIRANLSELSGARRELENLKTYYRGDYYIGQEANEALFKSKTKSSYSIIHFAMHGLLDENLPELSSLAFSESVDTTEDNFLTAYEIAQLPQRSQLVVLSACETAKGKLQVGEGVMSLAQYFLYGGAPAVVATRWQVNDQTTAFIMQNFYKYLYEGQTIKAALRTAQLDYLAQAKGQGAHPFYWSPFTNVGDTDKIVYLSNANWALKYYIGAAVAFLVLSLMFFWLKFKKKG